MAITHARPLGRIPAAALHTIPEDLDLATGPEHRLRRRRPRVFAHRGASGLFPEHSRAAYMRAIAEGADGLEIDLHLSRDGEAICLHDPTVNRTSNGHGAVADMTLSQLRALDVVSWKTPRLPAHYGSTSQQLMTLQDTLELLVDAGRDIGLAVEFKHPSPYGNRLEERALQVLLSFGWDPETSTIPAGDQGQYRVYVSFMSFYPGSLRYLAETVSTEALCALFTTVTESHVTKRIHHLRFSAALRPVVAAVMRGTVKDSESMVWNRQAGLAGPSVEYSLEHKAEIKAWVARGTRLRVWTVDSVSDAQALVELGVQELTTNYPARILRTVAA
ncbi:glycerophosphodiester phosphodiesterase [Nesterenkonia flava]|uniref:Glycerophosphodiester phosphodiesterase family protein n=1 Tax=Nesterenkonia flava TaxID=469799 RepID=A0ABU1FTI1_9MICC|nr:glycerophosphodiester phosphodiesterase family protein [Nesterenkonia flava]MDR5711969.1 glycerophosphodiester phosphodiesterase family protein [Nesterenkonia flava]